VIIGTGFASARRAPNLEHLPRFGRRARCTWRACLSGPVWPGGTARRAFNPDPANLSDHTELLYEGGQGRALARVGAGGWQKVSGSGRAFDLWPREARLCFGALPRASGARTLRDAEPHEGVTDYGTGVRRHGLSPREARLCFGALPRASGARTLRDAEPHEGVTDYGTGVRRRGLSPRPGRPNDTPRSLRSVS
jgi:hypothetical protein